MPGIVGGDYDRYHSAVTLLGTPSICPGQGLTPLDRVLVQVVGVVMVGLA